MALSHGIRLSDAHPAEGHSAPRLSILISLDRRAFRGPSSVLKADHVYKHRSTSPYSPSQSGEDLSRLPRR